MLLFLLPPPLPLPLRRRRLLLLYYCCYCFYSHERVPDGVFVVVRVFPFFVLPVSLPISLLIRRLALHRLAPVLLPIEYDC